MALLTITQTADLLGVSTKTIRRRIASGEVKAEKQKTSKGYRWLISPDALPPHWYVQRNVKDSIAPERDTEIAMLHQQLKVKDQQIQELHSLLREIQQLTLTESPKKWWKPWR